MTKLWYYITAFLYYVFGNPEYLKLGGATRSPKWRKFRTEQIKLRGGRCELCDGTETLELHHVESFSSNPSRELDPDNVAILCESGRNGVVCHQFFGHLGNYRKINPQVFDDIAIWKEKLND